MTRIILFVILLHFSAFTGYTQDSSNSENVLFNVTYTFTHVNNLNDKLSPVKQVMVLSLGKSSSRYLEYEVFQRIAAPEQKVASTAGLRVVTGKPAVLVGSNGAIVTETLFQFPNKGQLEVLAFIGNKQYLAGFPLPKINWSLKSEFREIEGYKCQKAVGDFGGRTYTVWFTADLPFNSGPYKLSGLPGLILEAEDANREVRFTFKSIEREDNPNMKIDGSKVGQVIQVSQSDYKRAVKAYIASPETYMQQQLPAGSPKVTRMQAEGTQDKSGMKTKFLANPVELKAN